MDGMLTREVMLTGVKRGMKIRHVVTSDLEGSLRVKGREGGLPKVTREPIR
jgi:hypothetical protein